MYIDNNKLKPLIALLGLCNMQLGLVDWAASGGDLSVLTEEG